MPDIRGMRHLLLPTCLFALIMALGCDEDPQIHSADEPVTQGGVQFEVDDYAIHYLELTDSRGDTIEYPDPLLAVGVTITNSGEDDFVYNPPHGSREMSQARTPLLFPAPTTPEIDWEEFTPQYIGGVELERGIWDQQIQDQTNLAAGDSISDYFLFEVPESHQSQLVLSIPPVMHRAELPVFIQFDYSEPEPQGPPVYGVGDAIDFDGVTFTVTAIEQTYVELEDSSEGDGFSNDPVLQISYTIDNSSGEAISFNPAHRDVSGNEGGVVQSLHASFNRVRFPANTTPKGQQERMNIEDGESIDDFTTFELPDQSVETATYMLPASHFDRSGRVRVAFSYEPQDVEEPEELQQD